MTTIYPTTGHAEMAEGKIVILGAGGMLGTDVAAVFRQRGILTANFDLPEFDITNPQLLRQTLSGAGAVINCTAYTNVEKAESESELAHKINGEAVGKLGEIAKENGSWVLHISTDFVFDGKTDKPYTETDQPGPINEYGRSKLAGERLLIESGCRHCIMRVEWTYGSAGKNFVTKLVSAVKEKGQLDVVDDQIGSPTATTEVASVICHLLERRPEGMFHFAADGFVSRYEMAEFIFQTLGMNVDLRRCKSADFPNAAKRPLNSRFDCGKIKALLGETIENWQRPLERFLKQL